MVLTNLSPTVVLVNELGNDTYSIKLWLEANGYNVREVTEIYDVLEEMTDFTLEQRPSMILLNSYLSSQDCSWIMDSFSEFPEGQGVPIVSLSEPNNRNDLARIDKHFVKLENFDSLKPLMQTFLPINLQARAVA